MPQNSVSLIEKVCLTYIVTWAVSPPIQYGNIYRLLCVVCFLIIEMLHILSYDHCIKTEQAIKFAFVFILLLLTMIFDGVGGVSIRLQVSICLMLVSLYDIYEDKADEIQFILWWMLFLLIIWNLETLYAYSTQRNVSRMLAKDFVGAEAYAKQGIEGYGSVYSLMLMLPVTIRLWIKKIRELTNLNKVILSAFILTTIALIVSAGYFIAIIISIIGLAGVITCNFSEKNRTVVIVIIVIISIGLIANAENILNFLSNVVEGTMYEVKIDDMIQSLSSDGATGTVYGRWERYSRSVKLFFESPIWGQLTRADVGKHSQILDLFAQFGIFIGTWFCLLFTQLFKCFKSIYTETFLCSVVEIMLFMFMLLNNLPYMAGAVLGVFLPVALYMMEDNHEYCE